MHSIFSPLFILKTEWSGESQNCRTGNGVTVKGRDFKAVMRHCGVSETGSDRSRKKKSRALSEEVDKREHSVTFYLVL